MIKMSGMDPMKAMMLMQQLMQKEKEEGVTENDDISNTQTPVKELENSEVSTKLFLIESGLNPIFWLPKFNDAKVSAQDEKNLKPQCKTLDKYQQLHKHAIDSNDKHALLKVFSLEEKENSRKTTVQSALNSKCRIETLSDGLILKGLIQNEELDDQKLRSKESFLESCNVIIQDCLSEQQETVKKYFSSFEEETEFFNCITNSNCCTSHQPQSSAGKNSEALRQYASTCKIFYLPLASVLIDESSLCVSKCALSHLQNIEEDLTKCPTVPECELQFACETFFETFGSHISYGPYQVGGIYWLKAYSEGFEKEELDEIKQLQEDAINGVDIMSHDSAAASSKIQLETGHCGGPSNASDFNAWKDELLDSDGNYSNWIVLDRNQRRIADFVSIQKIVQSSGVSNDDCKASIQISDKTFQQLRKAWKQMKTRNKEIVKLDYDVLQQFQNTCNTVKQWLLHTKSKQDNADADCLSKMNLQILLHTKKDHKGSISWSQLYLSEPCVQCYFRLVTMFAKNSKEKNSKPIQTVLKNILERSLFMKSFLEVDLIKWLYPPIIPKIPYDPTFMGNHDLPKFIEFVEMIVNALQRNEIEESTPLFEITTTVTSALSRTPSQKCEFSSFNSILLITFALPLGFDTDSCTFKTPLTLKSLNDFKMELNKASSTLSFTTNTLQKQLFLFCSLVKRNHPFGALSDDIISRHIAEYLNKMENLNFEIQIALCKCQKEEYEQKNKKGIRYDLLNLRKLLLEKIQDSRYTNEPKLLELANEEKDSQAQKPMADFTQFLERLNCKRFLKHKKSLQDVLEIKIIDESKLTEKNLIDLMTEKLKMSSYTCRSLLISQKIKGSDTDEVLIHPMDSIFALLYCANNFLRQDLYFRLNAAHLPVPLLYPDPLSNELIFPLWSLRSIVRAWKCRTSGHHEERLVNSKAPLVSFMRFSRLPRYSKSSIANEVIGGDSPKTLFFSHFSYGSSAPRMFADGILEACWYLPSGEERDCFDDIIAFANLRGNAVNFNQQFDVICSLSLISFVFITEEDIVKYIDHIVKLNSVKGKVIFIVADNTKDIWDRILRKIAPNCTSIHLPSLREPSAIKKRFQKVVQDELEYKRTLHTNGPFLNDLVSMASSLNINIDEDINFCQKGKALALNIKNKLETLHKNDHADCVKENFIPLQGHELWQKWASKNKEQYDTDKIGEQGIETFRSQLNVEKQKIRSEQLKKYLSSPSTSLINAFIDSINDDSFEVRVYFLRWLKFYLDDRSRSILSFVRERAVTLNQKLLGTSDDEYKSKIQHELEANDKKLVQISFGIEHLFRELGQIYECARDIEPSYYYSHGADKSQEKKLEKIKKLPHIAASLFFTGHPLEIVDGDAAHIPKVWVSAILKELAKLLKQNNSRLSVISVLGNQSTGKSTLINTMFGVQFAVGAGRCTRGAFMQMIKVSNSKKRADYLIVIDTEGLKAPEFMSSTKNAIKHDNELATLVIGLADTTIVNISGEIAGDIKDVLTTSVHAFLRMRQVDLNLSCQIVRHNVPTVASGRANEFRDLKKFQKALDEMTVLAAQAERCAAGKYKEFNDVIAYNYETDLHDFPTLFYNPPMAPVNDAYCEAARKLKSKLISKSAGSNTITTFREKLKNLWKAVLVENFVFCFKNALEVDAFTKLEKQYSIWSWRFETMYAEWKDEMHEIILLSAQHDNFTECQTKFSLSLNEAYEKILEDMEVFFAGQSSDIKIIMVKWQKEYRTKLKFLKDGYSRKASKYIDDVNQLKSDQVAHNEMKKNTRTDVNRHFANLISETKFTHGKTTFSEEEIKSIQAKFDEMWEVLEKEVRSKHRPIEEKNFSIEIERLISKLLPIQQQGLMMEKLKARNSLLVNRGRSEPLKINEIDHLELPKSQLNFARQTGTRSSWRKNFMHHMKLSAVDPLPSQTADMKFESIVQEAQKESDNIIETFKENLKKFSKKGYIRVLAHYDAFCTTQFKEIIRKIDEFEMYEVVLSHEYRVDVLLEMGGCILRCLLKAEQDARDHHPLQYLEFLKSTYKGKFEALCNAAEKEKASAISLVTLVEKEIHKKLLKRVKIKLADDIKSIEEVFGSKKIFTGEVLLDLLRKNDFERYALHLQNISESYQEWITEFVQNYCMMSTDGNGKKIKKIVTVAEDKLHDLLHNIEEAAKSATKAATAAMAKTALHASICNIEQWLTSFQENLSVSGILNLNQQELHEIVLIPTVKLNQVNDDQLELKHFFTEFIKGLEGLKAELMRERFIAIFDNLEHPDVKSMIEEIAYRLQKNIAGCCEQCPFCKEQCSHILINHDRNHFCSLHRPQCLGKYKNVDTNEMVLDICTDKVGGERKFRCSETKYESHPFKMYQEIFPNWSIRNESHQIAPYWKWFTNHHCDQITELFKFKPVPIPTDWTSVTKEDAERDIKERFFEE